MSDESSSETFGRLIEQAKTGAVSLTADPAAFMALDKACQERKNEIRDIQTVVLKIYEQEAWGLGERAAPLTSAKTIVLRFREKAMTGGNNAFDTLEGHYQAAVDMQELFRTIRDRYAETDDEFAARLQELAQTDQPGDGGGR